MTRLLSAAPPRGEGSARHHALKCAGARSPAMRDCGPVERAHGALYTDYIWELWTRFPPHTQLVQKKYLLGRRRSCQTHFVHDSGSPLEGKAQRSLTSDREQVQQYRRKLQRSTHLGNGFTLPFAFDFNVCKPEGETLGGCKYLAFFCTRKMVKLGWIWVMRDTKPQKWLKQRKHCEKNKTTILTKRIYLFSTCLH